MRPPVYMDCHATTPVDPRVVEAMLPYLGERFGNAASRTHAWGWQAARAVDRARDELAGAIVCDPDEIVFTSGATESDDLALTGAARAAPLPGTIVSVTTEHAAVLRPLRRLEQRGFAVRLLPVDGSGRLDPGALADAIDDDTVLVSVMAANNEIGVLHDLPAVASIVRRTRALLHCDAAQALGRVPLDVRRWDVDLLSLSAHKIHGPKGIGALYVRRGVRHRLQPTTAGGDHEQGLRPGTPNVPGIVGFGRAAGLAREELHGEAERLRGLRDRLWTGLRDRIDDISLNGDAEHRLPNNLNVSFAGIDGGALLLALDGVALSTGSACVSHDDRPSHVLQALQLDAARIRGAVRFGLGRFNTEAEVDQVVARVAECVGDLRMLAPPVRGSGP